MYLTPQHILIAGATGLTGEHLLDRLLSEPTVTGVLAPTRRPLAAHPHLENPVGDLQALLPQLSGQVDTAFCCLGSTISRPARRRPFALSTTISCSAFARRARELGARHLVVISALAPIPDQGVLQPRQRRDREALKAMDWPQLTIARPSLLLGKAP